MPIKDSLSKLNFRLRQETIERCDIFTLTVEQERKFRPISSELFHFLYEANAIKFHIYFRIDRTMIEFIKPNEFSRELLDQLWQTMKKSGHRLEIHVLKSEFPLFTDLIDAVRKTKLEKLVQSNPNMDPKTISVFENLSGASQLVVKGGVTSEVVEQVRLSASYLMTNLIDTTEALSTLSRMVIHDPTLYDHSASVAIFSGLMARECLQTPVSRTEQEIIAQCGLYHDIGKTCVPTAVLNKPGRFTPEEFEVMKSHTTLGEEELLEQIKKGADIDTVVARVAGEHHERYCGHGYPRGKKGCLEDDAEEGIHLYSRVVAIADVYSALLMKRVYKPAYEPQDAIKIMAEHAERDFDPNIFDRFLNQVVTSLNREQEELKMHGKGRILYFDANGQLSEKKTDGQ